AATVQLHGAAHQMYPLMTIPADFAGRQIAVGLYNPGVGNGDVTVRLVPPASGGTVTYPSWARMTTVGGLPAIQTSLAGDNRYHGKWVRLLVTLPPDYAGGQWQIAWDSTAAPAATTLMTTTATLIGKPVQLITG
ncbi:MAG: hypothetical protein H0X24_06725, partial [Ktedonobacterales bacterium]|nr:hypothetical protein [Ktedonobacterales bacterium]